MILVITLHGAVISFDAVVEFDQYWGNTMLQYHSCSSVRASDRGTFVRRLLCGTAALALISIVAAPAWGQSTGTQEIEGQIEKVVVTGGRTGPGGAITPERRPKTRSTIDDSFIGRQGSGQTIFQSLNLVPGFNFTNNDPYGSSGGNVRLRGFDGNRISVTVDGVPLNDTGNYAIFTNQMVDPEFLARASVNTGTTDVDSPTASATGGTINFVTRRPYEDTTLTVNGSAGSFQYQRLAVVLDSGMHNGVGAFGGVSFQQYDKFKGPGELKKTQGNARIFQFIGEDSFISVIGHYNENRNHFYRTLSLADIATFGDRFENFSSCTRDAADNGIADNDGSGADTNNLLNPSSCTNFYGLRINPSNTGNVRAQGNFALTDNLRLTIDPSWQYVKANGGGTTPTSETDARLGLGTDLNGDADLLDSVRLYTPSNTNTSRYGVTASLIYTFAETNTLRVAYTGDHGRHRQTGAMSRIDAEGNPVNIFGGLDSQSAKVFGSDGSFMRSRDRLSHAILNQVSLSYTGTFVDDRLLIDIGVRAPYFSRDLNQRCFSQSGSTNVRCTTELFTDADGDGIGTLASQGATVFVRPYSTQFEYDALLPNVGVSFDIAPEHTVYASYGEGLSAPRTDNLYLAVADEALNSIRFPGVEPERTRAFDLGYRFQAKDLVGSMALWFNEFENRIVTSFDSDLGVTVDRNVGKVELQGIDAELGWKVLPELVVYASVSYIESELQDDIALSATTALPTKGRTLVETPDLTFGGRVQYSHDYLTLGLQGKHVGERFSTDVNDQIAPSYVLLDFDASLDLSVMDLPNMSLQLNATNILDESWLGSISSATNATVIDVDPGPGVVNRSAQPVRYNIGSPQTVMIQLKSKF